MINSKCWKKIDVFLILQLFLSVVGILTTTAFSFLKYTTISGEDLFLMLLFFSNSLIFALVYLLTHKIGFLITSGALLQFSLFLLFSFDFFITKFYFTPALLLLFVFVSYDVSILIFRATVKMHFKRIEDKKILLNKIQEMILRCQKSETIPVFMSLYKSIITTTQLYNSISSNTEDDNRINFLTQDFFSKGQYYLRKSLITHYTIIYDEIKSKNLGSLKKVYNACCCLKEDIKKHQTFFAKENQKLLPIILEKIYKIQMFAQKYLNIYNIINDTNVDTMSGQEFERYCANLLIAYGFQNIVVTKGSGDQGVDIIGNYGKQKYAIQCKRHSHKLGNSPVQEVAAGKNYYKCDKSLVITNNYFTDSARQLAKANDVILWDRNSLSHLICLTDTQWDELLKETNLEEHFKPYLS